MTTLSGIPIDPDECIGDSLLVINDSFAELDKRTTYLLSAVALAAIDTDTIDLERNSTSNTLSANVKNASITNSKIAFDGGSFCFRNKLINGSMSINQRTFGDVLSIPLNISSTEKNYVVDRWSCECAPQQPTNFAQLVAFQSSDAPNGFTNSLAVSVAVPQTSHTPLIDPQTRASLSQTIEVKDIVDLKYGTTEAVPLTLSFWVKSNYAGNYTGQVKTLTESGSNRSRLFAYTLSSTSWEYKTINIPGDTDVSTKITSTHYLTASNSAGMSVEFNIGSGNNYGVTLTSPPSGWISGDVLTLNSFVGAIANISQLTLLASALLKITGIQLEKGITPTPFEYRPLVVETSLCQRYFETSYPLNTKPGSILTAPLNKDDGFEFYNLSQFVYSTPFQTEKRDVPSVAESYDPTTGIVNQANIREVGTTSCTTKTSTNLLYPKTNKNKIAFEVNPSGIIYANYYGLLHWVADSEIY